MWHWFLSVWMLLLRLEDSPFFEVGIGIVTGVALNRLRETFLRRRSGSRRGSSSALVSESSDIRDLIGTGIAPFAGGMATFASVETFAVTDTFAAAQESPQYSLRHRLLPEPERFTDVTLYHGEHYTNAELDRAHKLSERDALFSGRNYTLEVAIRRNRSGIGADYTPNFAILNPRLQTEALSIFVVATTIYGPIVVENPVAQLSWLRDKDSTAAIIRLRPGELDQPSRRAEIDIRLYHSNLDLLDVVRLTVSIATDRHAEFSGSDVRCFRDEGSQPHLDPDIAVRAVNIRVRNVEGGYRFTFIFLRGDLEAVLPFTTFINTPDLQSLLRRIREFWTELAITTYANKVTVTVSTWRRHLAELRDIGLRSWLLLFSDIEGDGRGAAAEVGDLLRTLDIGPGTHVQINYDESVADFVFPWSLLYPPDDSDAVDTGKFWGARFQIEQVWHGPSENHLDSEPVDVTVGIDRRFSQSGAEEAMFLDFLARGSGRLSITNRSDDLTTLLIALRSNPASHLYYFFCHGYAPSNLPTLQLDGLQMMEKAIAAAPEETRAAWQTLLTLMARMGDEAWMLLGDAEITESTLQKERGYFRNRRPIIFLNMCQSAAIMPSMTSGLVRLFLRRSASAVIGTEAPMTSVFAHAFAEKLLSNLFAGKDVGTALFRTRRHFLGDDQRNLLCLAYTLYGRATVSLCREPIVPLDTD